MVTQIPEARYAYYRRCQVFRKNGEQCKAPAEKDASICHAHAGQRAMALRRERERQAVLAEAVAEIRGKGRPEFGMADLFMDFESIQVTLAVIARKLMNDRIDCKTAGRLLVDLQTVSKLLRLHCTKTKTLSPIDTDNTELRHRTTAKPNLSTEPSRYSFHQDRTGVVSNHEDAPESRSDAVAISAGNAASAGNTKIVAIRSPKQVPSPFRTFQRHGSSPVLLTG
jgi:hypothetical protein